MSKKWFIISNVSRYLKLDTSIRFETLEECREECERLRNLNPLMNCYFLPCHEDTGVEVDIPEEMKEKIAKSEKEVDKMLEELERNFNKK